MDDIQILSDSSEKINRLIEVIHRELQTEFILFGHQGGSVIAEHGQVPRDTGSLAILSAAALASMKSLVNRMNEKEFPGITYNGENRSFFILPIEDQAVLLLVFSNQLMPEHIEKVARSLQKKFSRIWELIQEKSSSRVPLRS